MLSDSEIMDLICDKNLICIPNAYRSLEIHKEQTPISRGLSSAGYDLTLSDYFSKFNGIGIVDPLYFKKEDVLETYDTDYHPDEYTYSTREYFILPGGGFALARSVEVVNMPEDLVATAVGKSTYARCGLIVNVTPIEPGFSGQITLELHNASPNPVKVYPFMGICQLQFHRLSRPPILSYAAKGGKYQNQMGITYPRKGESYDRIGREIPQPR